MRCSMLLKSQKGRCTSPPRRTQNRITSPWFAASGPQNESGQRLSAHQIRNLWRRIGSEDWAWCWCPPSLHVASSERGTTPTLLQTTLVSTLPSRALSAQLSSRRPVNETTSTTNLGKRFKDKSINTWPRDGYRRGDVRNVSGVKTRHRKCGNHGHLASVCKCDGSQGKKKRAQHTEG